MAEIAVDYKLAVARPAATKGLEKETELVNSVLDELAAAKETGFNIELVDPGKSAELRFAVMRENAIAGAGQDATDKPALWFLPASGDVTLKDGSKPPLIIIHPDDRQKLVDATAREFAHHLPRHRPVATGGGLRLQARGCRRPVPGQAPRQGWARTLAGFRVPRVSPGDEVHVLAKNSSDQLVDINVLYVGSDYSITHIVAERLAPQATLEEGLLAFTDTSFGMERMIAVLTEAPPESEKEDLSFLAQDGVASMTRGLGPASFSDMLADIGAGAADPLGDAACRQERAEGRGDDLPDGDGAARLSPAPGCSACAGSCAIGAI